MRAAPYLLHITLNVPENKQLVFHQVSKNLVEAQQKHPKGHDFATYATYAGDLTSFHIFTPFEKLGDLDDWPDTREVALEVYGDQDAEQYLTPFAEALQQSRSSILILVQELSNLYQEEKPAPYLHYRTFKVKPDLGPQFHGAAQQLAAAQGKHPQGKQFAAYATYAGGADNILIFTPLQRLGELDDWVDLRQIAHETFRNDAQQFVDPFVQAIEDSDSGILINIPDLNAQRA